MTKFYIEYNLLNDIEYNKETGVWDDIVVDEYVVCDRATNYPICAFKYDWQAIKYCRENDSENDNLY